MPQSFDFHKEWEKTRAQLLKFSKEALVVAKKGEEELVKFSKKSKLHVDSTATSLKKEHLYYLIGKEYVKAKAPSKSAKLKKLLEDLTKINRDQKALKVKIKKSSGK